MRALLRNQILILLLGSTFWSGRAFAQNEPRFAPPRPVTSDPNDFEDPGEEDPDFAGGGDFPRPMPSVSQTPPGGGQPMPLPGGVAPPPPVMGGADFVPQTGGGGGPEFMPGGNNPINAGKIHFKIVSGAFWHKGMKRTVKHLPEEESIDDVGPGAAPAPAAGGTQYAPPPMDAPPDEMSPENFSDDPSQF